MEAQRGPTKTASPSETGPLWGFPQTGDQYRLPNTKFVDPLWISMSLCPTMSGIRCAEDVAAAHKLRGRYDPPRLGLGL